MELRIRGIKTYEKSLYAGFLPNKKVLTNVEDLIRTAGIDWHFAEQAEISYANYRYSKDEHFYCSKVGLDVHVILGKSHVHLISFGSKDNILKLRRLILARVKN